PRGPQAVAVVVHGHRAVDDLVPAVVVDVPDGEAVGALTVVPLAAVGGGVGVEGPAAGEGTAPPVPGRYDRAGVVAAGQDQGGGSRYRGTPCGCGWRSWCRRSSGG